VCCSTTPILEGETLPLSPFTPQALAINQHRASIWPVERITVQSLAGLGEVPLHLHRTMDQRGCRAHLETHSQGDFALPAPIDLKGVPAPKTPDHFMETGFTRDQKGSISLLPLPWNHPIDQDSFTPLEPRPTLRGLDVAILSKLDHDQGTFSSPLKPSLAQCGYPLDFVCL
jgi:hypothetical protein